MRRVSMAGALAGGLIAVSASGVSAQPAAAPTAGSGGGGNVGASVSTPTSPTGKVPPGTPGDRSVPGREARDAAGQSVIGKTTTPPGPVPGNTGGQGTGAK